MAAAAASVVMFGAAEVLVEVEVEVEVGFGGLELDVVEVLVLFVVLAISKVAFAEPDEPELGSVRLLLALVGWRELA